MISRPLIKAPTPEIEEKPFVPEMIENGAQKLALALGGLAVQSITSLLIKKTEFKKAKKKINTPSFIFGKLSEDNEEFEENSYNIFLMAANNINSELDKFDTIIETHSSNRGFLTIRTKGNEI